jgi:hypothetical protein
MHNLWPYIRKSAAWTDHQLRPHRTSVRRLNAEAGWSRRDTWTKTSEQVPPAWAIVAVALIASLGTAGR